MHEWGQWDASLGKPAELADWLTVAWLRRKRVEARLLAVELVTILGIAMGGNASATSSSRDTKNSPETDMLLRSMGVNLG